jgi:hypothetical protein
MESLESVQPKPRDAVLSQYMNHCGQAAIESNPFWHSPDKWYRWLVRLDCGCITEALTREDIDPPTEHVFSEVLGELPIYKKTWILHPPRITYKDGTIHPHEGSRCALDMYARPIKTCPYGYCYPAGYLWCAAHGEEPPMREITEWLHRKQEYRHGNRDNPYSLWTVRLSCGHCGHASSDVEWSPGMPHVIDRGMIERYQRDYLPRWKAEGADPRMIRETEQQIESSGFLVCEPAMSEDCAKCVYIRRITEYRMIGRLADHPVKPAEKPQPAPEEIADRKHLRLARVERDLARLQKEAEKLRGDIG